MPVKRLFANATLTIPTRIDRSAVSISGLLYSPAVADLNFVPTLKVHAGIRFGGKQEFQLEREISVFPRGDQRRFGIRPRDVDQHAGSGSSG